MDGDQAVRKPPGNALIIVQMFPSYQMRIGCNPNPNPSYQMRIDRFRSKLDSYDVDNLSMLTAFFPLCCVIRWKMTCWIHRPSGTMLYACKKVSMLLTAMAQGAFLLGSTVVWRLRQNSSFLFFFFFFFFIFLSLSSLYFYYPVCYLSSGYPNHGLLFLWCKGRKHQPV